jgi:hypothetical protein
MNCPGNTSDHCRERTLVVDFQKKHSNIVPKKLSPAPGVYSIIILSLKCIVMSDSGASEKVSFAGIPPGKINPGLPQRTRHPEYIAINNTSKKKSAPIWTRYDVFGEHALRKDGISASVIETMYDGRIRISFAFMYCAETDE